MAKHVHNKAQHAPRCLAIVDELTFFLYQIGFLWIYIHFNTCLYTGKTLMAYSHTFVLFKTYRPKSKRCQHAPTFASLPVNFALGHMAISRQAAARVSCACTVWKTLWTVATFPVQLARDLLNPSPELERRRHKKKRLVQSPNSYFMDVKCPGE